METLLRNSSYILRFLKVLPYEENTSIYLTKLFSLRGPKVFSAGQLTISILL